MRNEFGATAWFGAIDGYIEEAIKTGNNEQGDKYEGVFARVKRTPSLCITLWECLEMTLSLLMTKTIKAIVSYGESQVGMFVHSVCMVLLKVT